MAQAPFLALITPLTDGGQPPSVGAPPHPSHPIYPGEIPTHPIVLPPANGGNWPPADAHPEHPIVIPPDGAPPDATPPPTGPLGKMAWKTVWTEEYGWAVVGVVTDPHVTPSKR